MLLLVLVMLMAILPATPEELAAMALDMINPIDELYHLIFRAKKA